MNKLNRRAALGGLAVMALSAPRILRAQGRVGWQPTHPIQLVVGFAPSGGSDVIARTIAEAAAPFLSQPMVVVNRPGAGGALAAEQVARAQPDGLTLLLAGGSESTSLPAHRDVPYDPKKSFRSVIRLTRHPHFICVRGRGGRFADMRQVIEAARAEPGSITHGSAGAGTLSHSLFIMLERRADLEFLHVPYTGGGPVAQALLSGDIHLGVQASDELGGLVASGDIKPIAVASAERTKSQPDVPTLRELGYDVVADNQKGWVGPAGMTDEMVAFYHDRFRQGMAAPAWRRFLERLGEADGYADGPGFQTAMDTLLDDVRASLRRS
ncbi:Bug family tripartite tricarboxylate transporter substrate binding protein [Pseudoroseomonas ludipueritiae]|uniref:Tripartite tricarboxylate transporter substrate binding protein n=1 Tax=Pseudoroseomonas ludipueritiae TaxID=198093 RepID=A0ABR7R9N8_9PROT|nr:tripartite tricarboxylate transporter substrate binding protein [Pseudoroseomonas ludipueritiae]MBC9178539.1 tripartite tricarboxylate transporter substrate binding protein [Pseudoroseomonas ludipueritiae]